MDFNKLKQEIQKYYPTKGGHTFDHTERVYNLAMTIAKKENPDLEVLKAAVLLHDIARKKQSEKKCKCHAEEGSIIARTILQKHNFPQEKIEQVCYAIKVHRKSKGIIPKTKEAKILQDADRLDAIGAVDISRVISDSVEGEYARPIYTGDKYSTDGMLSAINFMMKNISRIYPKQFHTKIARKLAKKRHKFSKLYIKTFIDEWEGKC